MYRRLSAILFPIAIIALIGAGIWGYQENQEKNAILIKAENQYQRAFHDLSFHIDKLHNELGSAIAVNSTSQDFYKKGLVNIWKISSQAQSEINQLPLAWLPFNETEQFLNHISEFSYRTAVRDLQSNPLTPDERKTLTTLFDRSKSISKKLQGVQNKVIANNLRWMDVEIALATQKESLDNSIVDGFRTVDKEVKTNTEMNWGPTMMGLMNKKKLTMLAGESLTPEQIKHKAAQFLETKDEASLQVSENGKGTEANSYSVTRKETNQTDYTQLDLTKNGGNVIFYMAPHKAASKVLDVAGAKEAAMEFLDKHGYKQMKAVNYDESQNIATLIYATVQDKVIVYPEKLSVQIALDDGSVVGFQAAEYIMEHKNHKWLPPKINLEQAKKELDPKFTIKSHDMALIKNEDNEEVLCYEIIGKTNGNLYKIYINAQTGYEEKIELIPSGSWI
ncbi:MAG: germination protein YpeB [Paenibacillaceae bacterium]